MKQYAKVLCADYNGHKDVLFMMELDDFRLGSKEYTLLATGAYDRKAHTLTCGKSVCYVYEDWSIKEISQHKRDWPGQAPRHEDFE